MKQALMTLNQDGKWYVAKLARRLGATTYRIVAGPYSTEQEAFLELCKRMGINPNQVNPKA